MSGDSPGIVFKTITSVNSSQSDTTQVINPTFLQYKKKVDLAVTSMLLSHFGVFRVLGGKKIYLL